MELLLFSVLIKSTPCRLIDISEVFDQKRLIDPTAYWQNKTQREVVFNMTARTKLQTDFCSKISIFGQGKIDNHTLSQDHYIL